MTTQSTQTVRTINCLVCGSVILPVERQLISALCKPCGEAASRKVTRCVVPMHKSNCILITDMSLLAGINNKGGLVK